ncbi:ketoacyl-synthetase C-terminal extension domain-containing protein [Rhodococcus sp. H29-C3]|uniref:ketoacyl-synthetase C-terminal extension domain-containing protein n=1 Tax=Rhodococcus sp. H29-C3 TaxID=3046307 RepID=UPI0032D592A6
MSDTDAFDPVGLQRHWDRVFTLVFARAGMLSPDNRCKFGDASADGFVRSEGVGVLLLRPLADAVADGDPIHAVIAGGGSSNDGSGSELFMAPARSGQRLMLERAYADAGIDPRTVSYVEAHGTGTQAGDPVEIGALHDVLGRDRAATNPLFVGSVKTNIGHAEAAAGILGMIKAVLISKHRLIPANLNLHRPNPDIDWDAMAIRIPTHTTELPDDAVIGVNAFGVSGTNVHIVLTGAPPAPPHPQPHVDAARSESGLTHLLTLSAPTEEALRDTIRFHLAYFGTGGTGADLPLADICYTAAVRRTHHALRTAVVGNSHDEMADSLRAILHDPPQRPVRAPSRVAFVMSYPPRVIQR